jgi:hypothetical protein
MAMRAGGTVDDFDVAGRLKHLEIDDDGAMSVVSAAGARQLFFHD